MAEITAKKLTVKKRIVMASNKLRIGKDGKNTYANYDYFKPDDIMKNLNPILDELDIITLFNLVHKGECYEANLIIEDVDSDEKVVYSFDIAKASVKGANEAQNSGATLTYAKRYSLMNAFNIADNDIDFDSDKMADKKQTEQNKSNSNNPNTPINSQETVPIDELKTIIRNMILDLYGKESYVIELKELTSFTGKDGNVVDGVESLEKLNDGRTKATYGKIKKLYEARVQA